MKKVEYDVIENVYSKKHIPNPEEPDSVDNKSWWKEVYHQEDEDSKKPEIVVHEIAFDGTIPVAVKTAKRGNNPLFKHAMFTAKYKRR
jgi:hypothetical protein